MWLSTAVLKDFHGNNILQAYFAELRCPCFEWRKYVSFVFWCFCIILRRCYWLHLSQLWTLFQKNSEIKLADRDGRHSFRRCDVIIAPCDPSPHVADLKADVWRRTIYPSLVSLTWLLYSRWHPAWSQNNKTTVWMGLKFISTPPTHLSPKHVILPNSICSVRFASLSFGHQE